MQLEQVDKCTAEQLSERVQLRVTTFNVLNPIFARINEEGTRESTEDERWLRRNEAIATQLAAARADVLCLQEYWVDGPSTYHNIFERGALGEYTRVVSSREGRADGCLTLLGPRVTALGEPVEVHFGSFADRVATILHLRVEQPGCLADYGEGCPAPELLLVNTHLTYPHAPFFSALRLDEVRRLMLALDDVRAARSLSPDFPVVICGDFNGTPTGNVFKAMLSHGFVSAVDQHRGGSQYAKPLPRAPLLADGTELRAKPKSRWVTHRTHTGRTSGVDYIWLAAPVTQALRATLAPLQAACVATAVSELLDFLAAADAAEAVLGEGEGAGEGAAAGKGGTVSLEAFVDALVGVVLRSDADEWKDVPRSIEQSRRERAAYQRVLGDKAEELLGLEPHMLVGGAEGGRGVRVRYELYLERFAELAAMASPRAHGAGRRDEGELGSWRFAARGSELFPSDLMAGRWPEEWRLSDHGILSCTIVGAREGVAPQGGAGAGAGERGVRGVWARGGRLRSERRWLD
ncbi:Endonuclease/exonuclease/phosphatase [Pavlovales sp. CCMP2436]|nr:Endonuclease/exonuclease/phosphatase [Pavlovales sp. CCMP2436]